MSTPRRKSSPAKKPVGRKKPAARKPSSARKTAVGRKAAKAEAAPERDTDVDDRWVPAAADVPAPPPSQSSAAKYMPFVWVLVAIGLVIGAVVWRANR